MEKTSPGDVTRLLVDWCNGDKEALDRLMPLVYEEMRRIAKHKFQQYGLGGALQPTALVHEAYLKMVDETKIQLQNRAHFYAIAANTIRRILIEDYRRRISKKRGGKDMTHAKPSRRGGRADQNYHATENSARPGWSSHQRNILRTGPPRRADDEVTRHFIYRRSAPPRRRGLSEQFLTALLRN